MLNHFGDVCEPFLPRKISKLKGLKDEVFPSSRASCSCRALREISRSPCLSPKVRVMHAIYIATLIATYTGADVTIVGNIIVQNNPTFLLLCWLL